VFENDAARPDDYRIFDRPTPDWFTQAKLGIFVHWGPYSVPAWAEPIGELGTIDRKYWYAHNPYSEWYSNTSRIDGSPAHRHQAEVFAGAPYDQFLDDWTARDFSATEVMSVIARTGARYFIPTTKHHDGVTLWDAPGTSGRNTVHRGPHRDLIAEFKQAAVAAGLKFGVYYSGGLDWHFHNAPPIIEDHLADRPNDAAYAKYAYDQVADLVDRYQPDILWNDIEWPDAGKDDGPASLVRLFSRFYSTSPSGVINDRWGQTHWDFRTSEYEEDRSNEGYSAWENTRGIGYSFAYNQLEDASNSLDGNAAIRHFVDVVSRGGNLLLNVGLTADGLIPQLQLRTLEALAAWNQVNGASVFDSVPLDPAVGQPSNVPWARWTRSGALAHAFVAIDEGPATIQLDADRLDLSSGRFIDGSPADLTADGDRYSVHSWPAGTVPGPIQISFTLR
jgi:alpha-L-fucosidase